MLLRQLLLPWGLAAGVAAAVASSRGLAVAAAVAVASSRGLAVGVAAAVATCWALAVGVAAAAASCWGLATGKLVAGSGLAGLGALIVGSGVAGMLVASGSEVDPVSTDLTACTTPAIPEPVKKANSARNKSDKPQTIPDHLLLFLT